MPQKRNPLLESKFASYTQDGKKTLQLECKHCTYDAAQNNSCALEHLTLCTAYHKKQVALHKANEAKSLSKRQRILAMNITQMPPALKEQLDNNAAIAVYIRGRPFWLYEDPYMKQLFTQISSNTYTLPGRHLVEGVLLDKAYLAVKKKVDTLLQGQTQFNFVLDESSNINSQQMVNLSVVVSGHGSFFIANENIGRDNLDSV